MWELIFWEVDILGVDILGVDILGVDILRLTRQEMHLVDSIIHFLCSKFASTLLY